jgi:hypothetical protein
MSLRTPTPRLPYDDAATPHDMYDDCRAAGEHLHLPIRTSPAREVSFEGFDPPAHVAFEVPESTARLAGALHLHLD